MPHNRTPDAPDESGRLDGAIIGLLAGPERQRPWSEDEIARELSTPGEVRERLDCLCESELVHRFCGLVSITRAAVRCDEIDQGFGPCERQRSLEDMILALLLDRAEAEASLSRQDLVAILGEDRKVAILDALDSMRGAGVIDCSDELVKPSRAALSYSRLKVA